jgi:hypothetical protein
MATGTAERFGDGDNGRDDKDAMLDRIRSATLAEQQDEPVRIRNVGGAVVRAEMTPHGWGQAATNAGYIALYRAMPRFDTPLPGYPPMGRDS